jgi:hypothetical protein
MSKLPLWLQVSERERDFYDTNTAASDRPRVYPYLEGPEGEVDRSCTLTEGVHAQDLERGHVHSSMLQNLHPHRILSKCLRCVAYEQRQWRKSGKRRLLNAQRVSLCDTASLLRSVLVAVNSNGCTSRPSHLLQHHPQHLRVKPL